MMTRFFYRVVFVLSYLIEKTLHDRNGLYMQCFLNIVYIYSLCILHEFVSMEVSVGGVGVCIQQPEADFSSQNMETMCLTCRSRSAL